MKWFVVEATFLSCQQIDLVIGFATIPFAVFFSMILVIIVIVVVVVARLHPPHRKVNVSWIDRIGQHVSLKKIHKSTVLGSPPYTTGAAAVTPLALFNFVRCPSSFSFHFPATSTTATAATSSATATLFNRQLKLFSGMQPAVVLCP
jgi:hypothetical protein